MRTTIQPMVPIMPRAFVWGSIIRGTTTRIMVLATASVKYFRAAAGIVTTLLLLPTDLREHILLQTTIHLILRTAAAVQVEAAAVAAVAVVA